jgi:hypothetical protein
MLPIPLAENLEYGPQHSGRAGTLDVDPGITSGEGHPTLALTWTVPPRVSVVVSRSHGEVKHDGAGLKFVSTFSALIQSRASCALTFGRARIDCLMISSKSSKISGEDIHYEYDMKLSRAQEQVLVTHAPRSLLVMLRVASPSSSIPRIALAPCFVLPAQRGDPSHSCPP